MSFSRKIVTLNHMFYSWKNGSQLKNVSQLEKCVTLRKCIIGGKTGQTLKYVLQFTLKKCVRVAKLGQT